MHAGRKTGGRALEGAARKVVSVAVALTFLLSLMMWALPAQPALAQDFNPSGSLPEVGKKVNQLIYPTFGNPAISRRGDTLTIEWDWRYSLSSISLDDVPAGSASDWSVYVTTSVAANVQHYNGFSTEPRDWFRFENTADPYGYGTYADPVNTVVNTRALDVVGVDRAASARWPEIFGQTGFVVDMITVEVPANLPLDLYDLNVEYTGDLTAGYEGLVPPGHEDSLKKDAQPHALQVVKEFNKDIKVIQISDTHVYGQEIQNWAGLNYNSMELREPRPGTPDRVVPIALKSLLPGYQDFPLDTDGDGKTNEGAIYYQEVLNAINLVNPDFVVFTGDSVYAQKNWNTYPKDSFPFQGTTGDVGSEYRFEYPWHYDELLALNVPIYCVPGNHDGYNWDGHQAEGGLEHDDGLEIWQDLYGPLYHSWDYGEYHFLGLNDMDWDKVDTSGNSEKFDRNGDNVLNYVINPHKWHGQIRGNGDQWAVGDAPAGSGLQWDPKDPATYTGQLAWIRDDLAANQGKKLRGVFLHHDPLYPIGSPPGMWDHASQFGISLPAGRGEGSQSLVHLMKAYDVAFEASGHDHADWVGRVRWYDDSGDLMGINSTSAELHVGNEALLPAASEEYAGYRLMSFRDGELVSWGSSGLDSDPENKWSVPGWSGLNVGTATPDNTVEVYKSNRPSLQWMEQDTAAARPVITDGEGTFSTPSLPGEIPLPLNEKGPFDDVTCKVKNTLDGSNGYELDITGGRIEFPMEKKSDGSYYAVENGSIDEQYDTDSGERMVVVETDSIGGTVNPVRVYIAGLDNEAPVVDVFELDDDAATTADLEVKLDLSAYDVGGSGMKDYRISNDPSFSGVEWLPYVGDVQLTWALTGAAGEYGPKKVYVQVRDAAMPGNVTSVQETITYNLEGPPAPTPTAPAPNSTWYLAEGSTDWGFACYVSIANPNAKSVKARVTYMPTGKANKTETITLPPSSQTTLTNDHLVSVMGGASDFSTKVTCKEGKTIAVDRTMTWNAGSGEEAHNSVGVTAPAKTWYLPEGSSAWGFECWLLIQNPNSKEASCTITYMIEGVGPKEFTKTVPANSRATFDMSKDIGNKDASIKVVSNVPVIPERAMYRNNRREGHDSIGTTSPAKDYYLAEGATGYNVGYITYVLVQNPQESPTDVSIIYQTGTVEVAGPSFQMPANSRKTIRVNDQLSPNTDVSTHVHGSQPIIAERAMYWNNGTGEACHDSIGMSAPHKTFYLPDGETSNGRETWTLVQNPNSSNVVVEITYMSPSGNGNVTKIETIGPNSRKTFNMAEHSGISGRAAIMVTSKTSGKKIMVERAMYWNSRGAGTDTIGGYSD